ncbi:MAG: hypothetical protein VXX85_05360 [Candidatus Margulisiibacteriota bacterium]|nr:hypothetical protein [Candidatus Margulisiibacteriota bacterium]
MNIKIPLILFISLVCVTACSSSSSSSSTAVPLTTAETTAISEFNTSLQNQ